MHYEMKKTSTEGFVCVFGMKKVSSDNVLQNSEFNYRNVAICFKLLFSATGLIRRKSVMQTLVVTPLCDLLMI